MPEIVHKPKIVLLGMMSCWPVAGVAWVTAQYLIGLRRLGFDVYYVESHGCTQTKFMKTPEDDGVAMAAKYISQIMDRIEFRHNWAYHDVHDGGRCFNMEISALRDLYRDAALLINLHGGHDPLPEHSATRRLVYLETDPVEVQIGLTNPSENLIRYLDSHCAYYTWGLNYGNPSCKLPMIPKYPFKPSCPLVVVDLWQDEMELLNGVANPGGDRFTTIGNWKQPIHEVTYNGQVFHWSKHLEFLKFIDLPQKSKQAFELALADTSYSKDDENLLKEHGWTVIPATTVSAKMDDYHRYLKQSRGEFSVAKDQNIRFRSGWFSERSAQYLAAGRPVIMQETGFSDVLPTGEGAFGFLVMDEIHAAVDRINSDYPRACKAALELAYDFFNYDVVLKPILADMGVSLPLRKVSVGKRVNMSEPKISGEKIDKATRSNVIAKPVFAAVESAATIGRASTASVVASADSTGSTHLPGATSVGASPIGASSVHQIIDNAATAARIQELNRRLQQLREDADSDSFTSDDDQSFIVGNQANYLDVVARLRKIIDRLKKFSTVAIISKGDSDLLCMEHRRGWHFPRNDDGSYAGHYPPDSETAISHLESLRSRGADYLVVPAPSLWWLDFYAEFTAHLKSRYSLLFHRQDIGAVFALNNSATELATMFDNDDSSKLGAQKNGRQSNTDHIEDITATEATCESQSEDVQSNDFASDDEVKLRYRLIGELIHADRISEASSIVRDGMAISPNQPELIVGFARCELARGNSAKAFDLVEHAVRIAPGNASARTWAAQLNWQEQKFAAVEIHLTELLRSHPESVFAAQELMRFYCARLEKKPVTGREQMLDRLVAICAELPSGVSAEVELTVSETLAAHDRVNDAIALFERAVQRLKLDSPAIRQFISRTLRSLFANNSFDDKRRLSNELVQIGSGYVAVHDSYRSTVCYHLAVMAMKDAGESGCDSARFNLAFGAMARGDAKSAMKHLNGVHRVFADDCARISWPATDCGVWPYFAFPLAESFASLKPRGVLWPKITVITPSFNHKKYVEQTLLSVLNQEYPNLEYIVVDGNSTDGSIDILRKYEPRLGKLIIESDNGQTEAINKGLKLATGEIILWINSDDLLGPGALYMAALTYLETSADLIVGFCLEHSDRKFLLANLPAASQATFNVDCLGDLFNFWFKGHFFYQPEVAFTRRILQKTGGLLDESLHYVMDYEFWVRCAKAGARLAKTPWPIGLFRKHADQKTHQLDSTIIEQANVRERFTTITPAFVRKSELRRKAEVWFHQKNRTVHVISTRADRLFSADTHRELQSVFAGGNMNVTFSDGRQMDKSFKPGPDDLIILLVHCYRELELLARWRASGHRGITVGWFWDNHHHVFDNGRVAGELDLLVPGHGFAGAYLKSTHSAYRASVPLCSAQWTGRQAVDGFAAFGLADRSDDLYGGFVRYDFAGKRNRLISTLINQGNKGVYFLEESALGKYFDLSPMDRFAQWAGHKASLCLPLYGDLSLRLFDALLTGQIPIVPRDVHDLDSVIGPDIQAMLPIIRIDQYTPDAVNAAHQQAILLFNKDGKAGVLRRHNFAVSAHLTSHRIASIIRDVHAFSGGA